VVDLDQRAILAEADAQRKMRFADSGLGRRDQPVAMRLVAEVQEVLDPPAPPAL
jgi:hypothetical protein